jgi:O-antigen/teichoic acid export membrane protein
VREPFTALRRGPLRLFAQTAGTRVLGILSSALLVGLLSGRLTPAEYGVYALFSTTYVFGNLILGLGLSGNLTAQVPGRDDATAERLLATFFLAEVGIGGVVLALALLVGADRWLAVGMDVAPYLTALRFVLLLTWIDLGAGSCLTYLLARKRFGAANVLTLLRASLLAPSLAVVWLWRGSASVTSLTAVWLGGAVVSLLFGVMASGLGRALRGGVHWAALRGAVPFGLMLASQSMTFYFLKLADRYFLARFVNLEQVGIYSFAYTLSNMAYSLTALVLVGLFQPSIVEAHNRGDVSRRDELLAQLTRTSTALVIVGALATAAIARPLIAFARPAYAASAPIIPWLLACLLPVVAAYPASIVLMLQRKLWASVAGGFAATALAAALDYLLIPRLSYGGALIASFAGFSLLAAVQHAVAGTWRFLAPGHFRKLPGDFVALLRSRPSA